jgi:hypothetical protein
MPRFYENLSGGSQVGPCERADGHTNMTKLTVTFRNFENTNKKETNQRVNHKQNTNCTHSHKRMKPSASNCYTTLTWTSFCCWISKINRHLTTFLVTTRKLFSVDRAWGVNSSEHLHNWSRQNTVTDTHHHSWTVTGWGRVVYWTSIITFHYSLFASVFEIAYCFMGIVLFALVCLKIISNSDLIASDVSGDSE